MNNPQKYNNPFALIQEKPSAWLGLTGSLPNGFLSFETPLYGVRAGFLNLYNTYISKGINTVEKIMPIYAPAGDGSNNPKAYVELVEKYSGLKPDEKIVSEDQLYRLGQAIVQVEEGVYKNTTSNVGWIPRKDFEQGFNNAKTRFDLVKTVKAAGLGALFFAVIGIGLYLTRN